MATSNEVCVALRPSSELYLVPNGAMMFHAQKVMANPISAKIRFLV
jgi:hypothetical protein